MSDRTNIETEVIEDANVPVLPEKDAYAPDDISTALFGAEGAFQGGKRVRAYLRATYTRKPEDKGKSWTLAPEVARSTFAHFLAQRTTDADVVTEDDAK
jgi:hypothetical protein